MLCSAPECGQPIRLDEEPHDGNHDDGCPRLKGSWEATCWCGNGPTHARCCMVCSSDDRGVACIPAPPLPAPRVSGRPFAWIDGAA